MAKKNKVQVVEEEDGLVLSYKWFSPKAFFLLFFSIFWNAITVSALVGAGAAGSALFLLPFLAVGLGVGYSAIATFVNKTSLKVSEDSLQIGSGPLPWFDRKKIPIETIKQFYVQEKEHYNQEHGNTYFTYQLRVILEDGQDEKLIVVDQSDSKIVKQVEHKIETFLGLPDYKIKGEYQALEKKTIKELPRHEGRRVLPSEAGIQNLKLGSFADYDGSTYEVKHQTQYDWNDSNTDKLLQLADYKNTELLTFIHQNKGIFVSYIEAQLGLGESRALSFDPGIPPQTLRYKEYEFYLEKHQKGKIFIQNNYDAVNGQQWIYVDESENFHLRIVVKDDGIQTAFFGKKESDAIFDNLTIV